MNFLSPIWLLALIPVAALAVAYVVVQRRRRRYAVRFASLPMLDRVVPRRPGWRRHVPATLVLLALTCLGLAVARPELTLRVPYDRATVVVAIDVSRSMAVTDVPPNRLEAAKAAATAFVEELPDTVNVGVDGEQVAVFRGVNTTVAGISLADLEERTDLSVDRLDSIARPQVMKGWVAEDRDDAYSYVQRLEERAAPECPEPTDAATPTPAPGAFPEPPAEAADDPCAQETSS